MAYYQKNNTIFYKVEHETKTFLEVFISNSQVRIMRITGEENYDNLMLRLTQAQFEASTEEAFQVMLHSAKVQLNIL